MIPDRLLKIFRHDIGPRQERTEYLIGLGLAKDHWLFQGVPYAFLPKVKLGDVEIIGHVTQFLGVNYGGPAHDLSELRDTWANFPETDRRAFACHLASAVAALEKLSIVHGDLSPGNVMVGPGLNGRNALYLCDFDGYYHKGTSMLPRKHNGLGLRPLGTPGYQYVQLIKRIKADKNDSDEGLYVETDRFAMAALICEIMAWRNDTGTKLGRGELLTEEIILNGNLCLLPREITDAFSAGFALLEKALKAGSIDAFPSPGDWLSLLGVPAAIVSPIFPGTPRAIFTRRDTTMPPQAANLTSQQGNFGVIHAELQDIAFRNERQKGGQKLHLTFNGPLPAAIKKEGKISKVSPANRKDFLVGPKDTIMFGGWLVEFDNSNDP